MMVSSIDAWIVSQPTLITRNKTIIPVIVQRQSLADSLARYMNQLGLERRLKVKTLTEILAADHADDNGNGKGETP